MSLYRPDIDGLRAVAVAAVIAFHISPDLLRGGYLGVDIFFVISGYLITSIVWREAKDGDFSVSKFYERRLRRIMPALLVVLVVASVFAVLLLLPNDLVGFGKSLIAALSFVSNIYFWRDTNYFSRAAEEKPLLHLWSLGVEEQFYLFFPLLLMFMARRCRHQALNIVLVLSIVSLLANIALNMRGGSNPAFFLLPTRAWEMGCGAALALFQNRSCTSLCLVKKVASYFGALLIISCLVKPELIPDFLPAAIPAVLGSSFLVWSGSRSPSFVTSILSSTPSVFLGKISYSLYLWHWPIIVFLKYLLVRELTPMEAAFAIALMMMASVASWHYIEEPFRRKLELKRLGVVTAITASFLLMVSAAFVVSQGWPGRIPPEASVINSAVGTNYRCPVRNYINFGGSRGCTLNLPTRNPEDAQVVLFGNSHAQMFAPLVENLLRDNELPGLLVPMNGCLPTTTGANTDRGCNAIAESNLTAILKLKNVQTVILGLTWSHRKRGLIDNFGKLIESSAEQRELIRNLDATIVRIERSGRRAIVIGPIPLPNLDLASILSRELTFGLKRDRSLAIDQKTFIFDHGEAISYFGTRLNSAFVPAHEVQCDGSKCAYLLEGRSLFADSNHIAEAELGRWKALFGAALLDNSERFRLVE